MKEGAKLSLAFMLVTFIALIGIVSCTLLPLMKGSAVSQWKPPRVVTIERGKQGINCSLRTWVSGSDGEGPVVLLVREGDILSVDFSGDNEMLFPYLPSDGTILSFKQDDYGFLLEGKRIMVTLSEDSAALEWISKAEPEKLEALRMCALDGPIAEAKSPLYSALQRLSKINPNTGWMVEESEVLHHVLGLFDPRWLLIGDDVLLEENDLRMISKEPALEYLWLNAEKLKSMKPLSCSKRLGILGISNWNPEETGPLPGDCESLRSLTVFDSAIKDLSGIASLQGLEELHLISCADLSDISALSGFPSMKAVNLTGCKEVSDLSVLSKLKEIKWLSLPPSTSQEQFDNIIRGHPDLRELELIKCESIKDLSLLRSLGKLESLVLLNGETDYTLLREMKSLRFLALSKEAFRKSFNAGELQKALPECLIVQAEPFCMGSGWILLLWPAVSLAWLLSDRLSKNRSKLAKRNA